MNGSTDPTTFAGDEPDVQAEAPPVNPLVQVHRLLRGRYWLAVILAVVFGGLGTFFGYRITEPEYRSSGLIRIKPNLPRILYSSDDNGMLPMFDAFVESQATLIKSQRVTDIAMQHPEWKALNRGLMAEEVVKFTASLSADHQKGSELIWVGFTDTDPEAARRAVSAVIDAYDRLYGENDSQSDQSRIRLLEERRSMLSAESKRMNEQIRTISGPGASGSLERLYDAKMRRLLKLETQLQEAEAAVAMNGRATTRPARERAASVESLALQIPEINRLLGVRRELERQLIVDRKQVGEKHPAMLDAQTRLEALQTQLDELVVFYQQLLLESGGQMGLVGVPLEQLKANHANVRDAFEQAKLDTADLGRKCSEIEQLRVKADEVNAKLHETNQRIDQLNTEAGVGGRISIESRGDRALAPVKDKRMTYAAVGGVGLGAIGVGLVMLLGFCDRRIRHISDVRETHDRSHRILGVLPLLPNESSDPEDAMMAAHGVHQIRMLLQRHFQPGRSPVFAITSSTPGAGKTSLTLALGLSFAASGARTLLIDCDIIGGGLTSRMKKGSRRRIGHILRRVGLISTEQLIASLKESKALGEQVGQTLVRNGLVTEADIAHALEVQQSAVVGLREALNGDPANECITGAGNSRLFLMPLGSARRQHVAQLSCPALLRVLEQVRGWFDVILIDTGPILGSLEASVTVMAADDTVMCVARGEQRRLVDRAIEQMQAAGGRLAGIVLNRVSVGDIVSSGMSSSTSRRSTGDQEPPPLPTIADIDHHTLRLGPISNAVVALADFAPDGRDREVE